MNNNQNKNLPEPIVVGNLRKQNRGTFGLIVFFVILILFAVFLPNITTFVSNYFNKENQNNFSPTTTNNKEENKEDPTLSNEEETYYEINENTNFIFENISFSTFALESDSLTFNVSASKTINLNSKDYYIEFYTNDKTFINRVKIDSIVSITDTETSVSEEVNSDILNNAKYLKVVKVETNTIPEITLNDNKLICKLNNDEITYIFTKNKLTSISEKLNLTNSDKNYSAKLEQYKNYLTTYANKNGVDINLLDTETSFSFTAKVDYSKYNNKINIDNFYEKDTLAKEINYEMTNNNYTCS